MQPPAQIGAPTDSIDTPALVIDLDAMDANLSAMAAYARDAGVRLRPHAKTHKVPEPREGFLVFDGISGRARPKGVPTISQRLDASGSPTWSTYLGPREPLPAYREYPRRRNALLGCAIGGGAVGLGTWVASNVSKGDLKRSARDQSVSADVLDGKRSRSNVLQATSWVGFGIGIGCGVGAVIESL